ncbi:lipopolysaccharide biosynthesis protein [Sphingomonas sp.]|jgi:O-antigen/teichoic acid export membrane protein|uniref:lipopolysaccharide biosynthesis protein n=1 Tax=Sphingomonas sp. TaxID=28214 RepID=UPI002DE47E1C|nr:lipopolysaccharide biosynthesis protein [Sphingomonas sp.]
MSVEGPRAASLKSAFLNFGWILSGRGVAAVLSLVYLGIITRTLGPEGFGQFALVSSTAQTITAIVGFQTWQIIVTYGMKHLRDRDRPALARLLKGVLTLDATAAIVGALFAVAAVFLLGPRLGWPLELRPYALGFCLISLIAVRSTPVGILRLHDRFAVASVADATTSIVRLIGVLIALFFSPNVQGFLMAWIAAEFVASATVWSFAQSSIRGLPWREGKLSLKRLRRENEGVIRFAGATNASQTFNLVGKQLPVLLVGFFSTAAQAGGFRLAHQLGRAGMQLSQLISRALLPELVRSRTMSDGPQHLRSLLKRTVRGSLIGGALMLAILFFAGKVLLGLVAGPAFLPMYPLLLLLGTAAVIDLVGVSFEPALIATGKAGLAFRIQLFVTLVLIAAMVLLLPSQGATGAGFALLISSSLGFLLKGVASLRAVWRNDPVVAEPDEASDEALS